MSIPMVSPLLVCAPAIFTGFGLLLFKRLLLFLANSSSAFPVSLSLSG
jgi:hypothetical protein